MKADCLRGYCSAKHAIGVCPFWCIYYISGFAWRAKEYKRIFLGQYCKTFLLLSHSSSLQNKHYKDNLYLETASSSCIQLWSSACFQCFLNTLIHGTVIFLPYFTWVITVINHERNGFYLHFKQDILIQSFFFFLLKWKHSFLKSLMTKQGDYQRCSDFERVAFFLNRKGCKSTLCVFQNYISFAPAL